MIATGLTFLLGALLTALVALLVAPLVWRKAQSLARREFEATIPASANEIRAEFDKVRAEAALSIRKGEVLASQAREKTARTQAEIGRATVENVEILKRNRKLTQEAEEREAAMAQIGARLSSKDEEQAHLSNQLATARREADLRTEELAALGKRFQDLTDIAEERKIQLIATEAKLDRLSDAMRAAERETRDAKTMAERLRSEATTLERTSGQERTAVASLNDRISTLLAGIADRDEEIFRLKEQMAASVLAQAAAVSAGPPAAPLPVASPAPRARVTPTRTAQQRLRATLSKRDGWNGEVADDTAAIREQIAELAARVIRMSSLAEGVDSQTARFVSAASEGPASDGSLAARVRRIAEAEKAERPGAAESARVQSAG